jgi:CheY-like chemotaxis protein
MMVYAGIRQFSIKSFHFNELIKDMVLMLQSSISKKTNLRLNLEPQLPFITGDITQIRQVIMNLVINASEACGTNPGDILVSTKNVYLSESSRHLLPEQIGSGQYVLLEVTDTGCGMDEDTQHKMFDPFFSTKFTGRGLGLAAVLGIIKGHRGGINVYSVPGQGTTVKVYFPISEENQPLHGIGYSDSQSELQIKKRLSGKTILVVDDEMVIRDTFSQYLYLYGCEVLIAEDGLAGRDLYLKHCDKIDVVILDLTMPNLSGKEVLIEIKKRNPLVKIILMSGWAEEEALKSFRHGDVAAFISKPPSFEDLMAKLLEVLGN